MEDEAEDEEEEEEAQDEEEEGNNREAPAKQDDQKPQKTDSTWGDCSKLRKGGLKCILRCNLQVKQTGGLISMEAYYLGGSCGKEGLNQMVQYMRNQLSQPLA